MQNNKECMDEQIRSFLYTSYGFKQPKVTQMSSGMNNTTRVVEHDGKKYNLRIYNNHRDVEKLTFEHAMLKRLQQLELSVQTPIPYKNLNDDTISILENGQLAAMFEYIEGTRPNAASLEHLYSLANAAGVLSKAFERMQIDFTPAYAPYYELGNNYERFDEYKIKLLLSECRSLNNYEEHLYKLMEERFALESSSTQLSKLPHNWIHGDINTSNAVAMGNKVIGIIDFEFVTKDLRAMELAVLLAEALGDQPKAYPSLQAIVSGFNSAQPLTQAEMDAMPKLVKLRLVDVAMHFIDRYERKLDEEHIVYNILKKTFHGLNYLDFNEDSVKIVQ